MGGISTGTALIAVAVLGVGGLVIYKFMKGKTLTGGIGVSAGPGGVGGIAGGGITSDPVKGTTAMSGPVSDDDLGDAMDPASAQAGEVYGQYQDCCACVNYKGGTRCTNRKSGKSWNDKSAKTAMNLCLRSCTGKTTSHFADFHELHFSRLANMRL
jgi:hypothetical protein